jgi:3-keto-L-gulonate-6-phosphate decarboxylase
MDTTLKQTMMPTQLLHLSVDVEMPSQVASNKQYIQEAIEFLLQNYSLAFGGGLPEQILQNLGIYKDISKENITVKSDALPTNEWEKMLERLGQDAMSPEEVIDFDKSRKEFRENFAMRDVMADETK